MNIASNFGFPVAVFGTAFFITFLIERLTRPSVQVGWSYARFVIHGLIMGQIYGLCAFLSGSAWLSGCVMVLLAVVGVVASNIKWSLLGEPLLFSDVVVAQSFLRNPKFYLFSIPPLARVAVVAMVLIVPALFIYVSVEGLRPGTRITGLCMVVAASLGLRLVPASRWAPVPDISQDIGRLGLIGSLYLYWRRWQAEPDGAPPPPVPSTTRPARDVVVVVQCESFADPYTLGLSETALPTMSGLRSAQAAASAWGALQVSGFGAYTMRTEYGVLFGRTEVQLGFRYFDPFLTAAREKEFALPYRLGAAGYRSVFVHPHDLGFYGRDRLMPAIGFERLIGDDAFAHAESASMPYTQDCDVADAILRLVDAEGAEPLFVYAVTMENHGPWPNGKDEGVAHYLRHLQGSDQMLAALVKGFQERDCKATLVFFGDHRPSIPGSVVPGGARHTPFVVVDFPLSGHKNALSAQDISPAGLHDLIEARALER